MTLLRDLIHIPERVYKGDFVLKLTEGLGEPKTTLRDYVVTDALVRAFDHALRLIESAVASGASKATYLHGSFGSGKSHFMAVLYLLLRQEAEARSIPELSEVVARHDTWLEGKRFLLVPYHLIGARNLESAILGGYVHHLRSLHPEAPQPAVYVADAIFDDAEQLRSSFGDEQFFLRLGQQSAAGEDGDPRWGALATGWDAASYERVRALPADSKERKALVSQLLGAFFPSWGQRAEAIGSGYVSMDVGLSELARHAAGLGYQGVVLFLDELILWLASRATGEPGFVERQIESLVKLVEAERADRPVPIVSFVARQRDLRKLIGDHMPGADRLRYVDKLDHYEGRFDKIILGEGDLHKVVERRLLRPRDEAARQTLASAFQDALRSRPEVVDTLLAEHDQEAFRAVYPFSPALIGALRALSSVLQRERTALKLLSELLAERRDLLTVGDLVPVGDLWDVLASGDEPFSEEMRAVFDQAKKLWRGKLRPLLEDQHHLAPGEMPAPGHAFHGDARLLRTILLAALAPEAQELRDLRVSRLVALNHGSIRSPIPGQENQLALNKLRDWVARGAGEIHLGDGTDPTLSLELSGVDIDSILDRVQIEDNQGNRAGKIRQLLFDAMGISDGDQIFSTRELLFKGTRRRVDVVFGNVRELSDERFVAGDHWKVVLDFPFDEEGYSPADDLARLDELRQLRDPTHTVCWLPSFFSRKGQSELGRLVLIDYLLTGERFDQNASHLAPTDRQSARALLRNQQTQLRERLRQALEVAYGLRDGHEQLIDRGLELEQHLQSLDPTFVPRPPVAATFEEALEQLVRQALEHQFPAHPGLGPEEVRKAELAKVYQAVRSTIEQPERRLRIEDKMLRALLRRIATPLRLGEMHEAHFNLSDHWLRHFDREAARWAEGQVGGDPTLPLAQLRRWFDTPEAMGLPRPIQDLVILLFAERTRRGFVLHGGPPMVLGLGDKLDDTLVLVAQELPSEEAWQTALRHAGELFGVQPLSTLLSVNSTNDLAAKVLQAATDARPRCAALVAALERRCRSLGVDGGDRLAVAEEALDLVGVLDSEGEAVERLRRLAEHTPRRSLQALGRTIARAEEVRRLVDDAELWRLVDSVRGLVDERRGVAEALCREVATTLSHDELAQPAAGRLGELRAQVVELLAQPVVTHRPRDSGAKTSDAATTTVAAPEPVALRGDGTAGELRHSSQARFDSAESARGVVLETLDQLLEQHDATSGDDRPEFELRWTIELQPVDRR